MVSPLPSGEGPLDDTTNQTAGPHDASEATEMESSSGSGLISEQTMPLDPPAHQPVEDEQLGYLNSASSAPDLSVDSERSFSDTDSAIGSTGENNSTKSVTSSVYDFVEENGRTYHRFREGKYYLPNDETEQDRLDLQHHLFVLTLSGELHLAPINDLPGGLHNALDIATGTGIWAIEFADKFPSANIVGTDLSPVQPAFVPPNCHFEVDDSEDDWNFSYKFDYIHGRALVTCFKTHVTVIESAFSALRPGGYLEFQDMDFTFRGVDDTLKGSHLEAWSDLLAKANIALGKDWTRTPSYKRYFEEAGFEDMVEKKFEWPIGTWARGKRNKILGMWYAENLLVGVDGISYAVFSRGLGMSRGEIDVFLAGLRNEIKSNKVHAYTQVRVVYGRKPGLTHSIVGTGDHSGIAGS